MNPAMAEPFEMYVSPETAGTRSIGLAACFSEKAAGANASDVPIAFACDDDVSRTDDAPPPANEPEADDTVICPTVPGDAAAA